MARLSAPLALLAAALLASAGAELPPEAMEALPADDACAQDPSSEECSASFRQLRGLQRTSEVEQHRKANASEDSGSEPGVCCYSAEDSKDVCGTCYPDAVATDAQCSLKQHCSGCGGTWCRSVCVMGAADPKDKCGTAFDTGIAEKDSFCAKDATTCAQCNGAWCKSGTKKASHVRKVDQEEDEETARTATAGFCCYRSDEADMCGACADVATDATCSTEANCGTCGGTWCAGPKCVTGFADAANPCTSAYPEGGVAEADSYCGKSKDACSHCSGSWCPSHDIKYFEADEDKETPSTGADDDDKEPSEDTPTDDDTPAPADGDDDTPAPAGGDDTPAPTDEDDHTVGDPDGSAPPAEEDDEAGGDADGTPAPADEDDQTVGDEDGSEAPEEDEEVDSAKANSVASVDDEYADDMLE